MGWGSCLAIGMLEAVSVQVWKRRGGNTHPPPHISLYILENGIFFTLEGKHPSFSIPTAGLCHPKSCYPLPCKQNKDNLAAYPGFCFQSHWEGMPGSLGVQQQINCIALTLFPLSDHRRKICCCKHRGKNQGSLLSHLPDEGKENEPWRGENRELK